MNTKENTFEGQQQQVSNGAYIEAIDDHPPIPSSKESFDNNIHHHDQHSIRPSDTKEIIGLVKILFSRLQQSPEFLIQMNKRPTSTPLNSLQSALSIKDAMKNIKLFGNSMSCKNRTETNSIDMQATSGLERTSDAEVMRDIAPDDKV